MDNSQDSFPIASCSAPRQLARHTYKSAMRRRNWKSSQTASIWALVGLIGRLHQHKDHQTFVRAARVVADHIPHAHFVGAGEEQTYSASDLWSWVADVGLRDRFHWLGVRRDVPAIDASLDVLVCSSTTEGFPNVVGEALACGVPCVATDVGECAEVIGDTGRIVPKQAPQQLGKAIAELLRMPPSERMALGAAARQRVVERYDINRIVERYRDLWHQLAGSVRLRQSARLDDAGLHDREEFRAVA